jgi:hypothetical protein
VALRATAPLIGAFLFAFVGVDETFEDGVRAYREGRFQDAARIFAAQETATPNERAFVVRYDLALAAWRAGEVGTAAAAARRAAEAPGADLGAVAFLEGSIAWSRALRAEAVAASVESEPFAYDAAIAAASAARDAWRRAATTRDDWPEARRNVERAARFVETLRERKKVAEDAKRKTDSRPTEEPKPPPERPSNAEARETRASSVALTDEQVRRLFERLDALEKERRATRLKERAATNATTERDW